MELIALELLLKYSKNDKLIVTEYIEKLVELAVLQFSLQNYVSKLTWNDRDTITDGRSPILASYDLLKKSIILYTRDLTKYLKKIDKTGQTFCDSERILFKNLAVTQIVLHELEHAKQNRILDSSSNSMEAKLLRVSFDADPTLGDQFYDYDPAERMADIRSFKTINMMISQIESSIPTLSLHEKIELANVMLDGYSHNLSPTKIFLRGTEQPFNKIFPLIHAYSLFERMTYGLPITSDEFKNVNETHDLLCRKLHQNK